MNGALNGVLGQEPGPRSGNTDDLMSGVRGAIVVGWLGICIAGAFGAESVAKGVAQSSADAGATFTEVSASSGIDFVHRNGMTGQRWLAEIVGSGVATLDFDGDGWMDLWLVQGGDFLPGGKRVADRLYRNVPGETLRFVDVTARSGVVADRYGMGIATGDIDNDGDYDVFLANYGANQLYLNLGDGRFMDITEESGITGDVWSVSASFADVNGDGLVDLYVGNYLDFTLSSHRDCRDVANRETYCAPDNYEPVADVLYINLGKGRFDDRSLAAGIGKVKGPALGVIVRDFDGDSDQDIYVANDGAANRLWVNRGRDKGSVRFEDGAALGFVAFNGNGAPEAGMGIAAADYDNDCDLDLFVTHLTTETNTLYINRGDWFSDGTNGAGLAASSGPFTGFGTGWVDFDLDGDLDIFSANGAVYPVPELRDKGVRYPLALRNQLWLNTGQGRYLERRDSVLDVAEVSRGAAFADLDNDGDVDVVVANSNGPARLYRNDMARGAWLGIRLAGGSRTHHGARAELVGRTCHARFVGTDGSYASASDARMTFGVGRQPCPAGSRCPDSVKVTWPDGGSERFDSLRPNRYHTLVRGRGVGR